VRLNEWKVALLYDRFTTASSPLWVFVSIERLCQFFAKLFDCRHVLLKLLGCDIEIVSGYRVKNFTNSSKAAVDSVLFKRRMYKKIGAQFLELLATRPIRMLN
jgi:hypothetical protein